MVANNLFIIDVKKTRSVCAERALCHQLKFKLVFELTNCQECISARNGIPGFEFSSRFVGFQESSCRYGHDRIERIEIVPDIGKR